MQIIFVHGIGLLKVDRDDAARDPYGGWSLEDLPTEIRRFERVCNAWSQATTSQPRVYEVLNGTKHCPPRSALYFFSYYGSAAETYVTRSGASYQPSIHHFGEILADLIRVVVAETGERVVLVGHSLGGLVIRAALHRSLGDEAEQLVERFIPVGSPQKGIGSSRHAAARVIGAIQDIFPESNETLMGLESRTLSEIHLRELMGKGDDKRWPGNRFVGLLGDVRVAAVAHTRDDILVMPENAIVEDAPCAHLNVPGIAPNPATHVAIKRIMRGALREALFAEHKIVLEGTLHVDVRPGGGPHTRVEAGYRLRALRTPVSQLIYHHDEFPRWRRGGYWFDDAAVTVPVRFEVPLRRSVLESGKADLLVGMKYQYREGLREQNERCRPSSDWWLTVPLPLDNGAPSRLSFDGREAFQAGKRVKLVGSLALEAWSSGASISTEMAA